MKLSDIRKTPMISRVNYLKLVAHMASIDGSTEGGELDLIQRMADRFEVKELAKKQIMEMNRLAENEITLMIKDLKAKKLQYSFLMDSIAMAVVDGVVMDSERLLLSRMLDQLDINIEVFHNLLNFAQIVSQASADYPIDPMYSSAINIVLQWGRQRKIKLFQQTTFAISEVIDAELKMQLEG